MRVNIPSCLKDASDSCLIPGVEEGARSEGTLSEQYCRKCDLKITRIIEADKQNYLKSSHSVPFPIQPHLRTCSPSLSTATAA